MLQYWYLLLYFILSIKHKHTHHMCCSNMKTGRLLLPYRQLYRIKKKKKASALCWYENLEV